MHRDTKPAQMMGQIGWPHLATKLQSLRLKAQSPSTFSPSQCSNVEITFTKRYEILGKFQHPIGHDSFYGVYDNEFMSFVGLKV